MPENLEGDISNQTVNQDPIPTTPSNYEVEDPSDFEIAFLSREVGELEIEAEGLVSSSLERLKFLINDSENQHNLRARRDDISKIQNLITQGARVG